MTNINTHTHKNKLISGRRPVIRPLSIFFCVIILMMTSLCPLAEAREIPDAPASGEQAAADASTTGEQAAVGASTSGEQAAVGASTSGEQAAADATTAGKDAGEQYTLDKVLVLSRHNIRSPMSGTISLLGGITPHTWFNWTSNPSELSVRGGTLETIMGQYFRKRLEAEGLFSENHQPEDGAVRFYANSKQRTIATSTFFSAGLLPVWDTPVETHVEYDTMDPVFSPVLHFVTPDYEQDVISQISEMGGDKGLEGIHEELLDELSLLMDVTDMEKSESYQKGYFGNLLEDPTEIVLEEGKEPGMKGPLRTGTAVADALTLQYYEEPDAEKAAFGHKLTEDDWRRIHSISDTYSDILFTTPLVSVNVAHPLLEEMRSELLADGRIFSFLCGHDSNIASVLAALGVKEYSLPDTIEPKTPIGVKLVFARFLTEDNEAWYTVSLVYQSTQQLRALSLLTPENPPMEHFLEFEGVETNADHMIAEDDLLDLFDNAISAYDELMEKYTDESLEPAA